MNEFYREAEVTARKTHECVEYGCKRSIGPGDRYVNIAGKHDGGFFTVKSCVRCTRLRNKAHTKYLSPHDHDEGITFGDLLLFIRECRR